MTKRNKNALSAILAPGDFLLGAIFLSENKKVLWKETNNSGLLAIVPLHCFVNGLALIGWLLKVTDDLNGSAAGEE